MKYLGIESDELAALGGIYTATEITQQPELWQKVWEQVYCLRPQLTAFLNSTLPRCQRIILTGAGTSAFIGISLRGVLQQATNIPVEAVATTDIVSHPNDYFIANIPTLLISFARSGNSPESVAAVNLADEICKTCFHLIITCNQQGHLAQYQPEHEKFCIVLPKESDDKSLVMTSSYTCMLLTGLLIARYQTLEATQKSVETVIRYAKQFLFMHRDELRDIANLKFNRAVFLGAGSFYGTTTEANLKLQELTDGKVICKNDSYLGFRHGPKSVINQDTLVVYILSSSNQHALKYEIDLINSMKKGTAPMLEISISETEVKSLSLPYMLHFTEEDKVLDDDFLALCYIVPVQILGFYKSLQLGLKPDAPSTNNDITRVVQGVHIYALTS